MPFWTRIWDNFRVDIFGCFFETPEDLFMKSDASQGFSCIILSVSACLLTISDDLCELFWIVKQIRIVAPPRQHFSSMRREENASHPI